MHPSSEIFHAAKQGLDHLCFFAFIGVLPLQHQFLKDGPFIQELETKGGPTKR